MAYQRKARGKPRVPGGYVDVPRHLYDAIMAAPFTLAQLKVALVIVRLTWGYYPMENHAGTTISRATIARYSGLSSCTVRNAMPSLVRAGVVEVVRRGAGRRSDVLRLCPEPAKWGRFEPVEVPQQVPRDELSTESAYHVSRGTSASTAPVPQQVPLQARMNFPFLNFPIEHEDLPPQTPPRGLADADAPAGERTTPQELSSEVQRRIADLARRFTERTP